MSRMDTLIAEAVRERDKFAAVLREIASWQNTEGVGGEAIRLARAALAAPVEQK